MAIHLYETPAKRAQLVRDFERMEHFLTRQHDVALSQGLTEYANLCAKGARSAQDLGSDLQHLSANPVTMFTGNTNRQSSLASVVEALNPVLGLPQEHPARTDPTIRASMRRMQNFIDWLYDDGNCGKPVRVTEFNLKSGAGRAQPAIALGLLPPDTATPRSEPARKPAAPVATA